MIRILMFCSYFPPQYSGAAKQAVALAHQLKKMGCRIEFATILDAELPVFDEYQGFPVHRIDAGGNRNQEFPFWFNLFKFTWKNRKRFDIFHSHGAHYINSAVGPISKMLGWKSLVKSTLYNNDLYGMKHRLSGKLHYTFLKMINAYIGISSDLVREFKGYGFSFKKIYYIPNGVDFDRFSASEQKHRIRLRKELGLPEKMKIVLSVGVFDKRKNIGWLIETWPHINQAESKYFLLAIGPQSREDADGVFLDSLKKIEKSYQSNMKIIGHVEEIENYYRAADIFILPSKNEGLPNVILEAMASGLPCLTTRASGVGDLVKEGVTGFFFETNQCEGIIDKLSMFNGDVAVELGKNARKTAEKKFSLNAVARQYFKLYNNLMDQ